MLRSLSIWNCCWRAVSIYRRYVFVSARWAINKCYKSRSFDFSDYSFWVFSLWVVLKSGSPSVLWSLERRSLLCLTFSYQAFECEDSNLQACIAFRFWSSSQFLYRIKLVVRRGIVLFVRERSVWTEAVIWSLTFTRLSSSLQRSGTAVWIDAYLWTSRSSCTRSLIELVSSVILD